MPDRARAVMRAQCCRPLRRLVWERQIFTSSLPLAPILLLQRSMTRNPVIQRYTRRYTTVSQARRTVQQQQVVSAHLGL